MRTLRNAMKLFGVILLVSLLLVGCGGIEKQVLGSWYEEENFDPDEKPQFTFYKDHTVQIEGEYGLGEWEIFDGSELVISNFYGETATAIILEIDNNSMTLMEGGDTFSLWKK